MSSPLMANLGLGRLPRKSHSPASGFWLRLRDTLFVWLSSRNESTTNVRHNKGSIHSGRLLIHLESSMNWLTGQLDQLHNDWVVLYITASRGAISTWRATTLWLSWIVEWCSPLTDSTNPDEQGQRPVRLLWRYASVHFTSGYEIPFSW